MISIEHIAVNLQLEWLNIIFSVENMIFAGLRIRVRTSSSARFDNWNARVCHLECSRTMLCSSDW
jgi:hypothetical protein